jgi:hypothetical protein
MMKMIKILTSADNGEKTVIFSCEECSNFNITGEGFFSSAAIAQVEEHVATCGTDNGSN